MSVESPGRKAVLQCTSDLTSLLKYNLSCSGKLLEKGLVTEAVHDWILTAPAVSNQEKAARLVSCLADRVKSTQMFHKLITALKEIDPFSGDIVDKLTEAFQHESLTESRAATIEDEKKQESGKVNMPQDHILNGSNLNDLMDPNLHIDYSFWFEIGLELGIKENKLNEIKANNAGKPDYSIHCAKDMFYLWLTDGTEDDHEPTYEKLADALSLAGMRKVAATILHKKCSSEHMLSNVSPEVKLLTDHRRDLIETLAKNPWVIANTLLKEGLISLTDMDKIKIQVYSHNYKSKLLVDALQEKIRCDSHSVNFDRLLDILSKYGFSESIISNLQKFHHAKEISSKILPTPKCICKYAVDLRKKYHELPIFPSGFHDWPRYIGKQLEYINLAMIEQDKPLSEMEKADFYCHNSLLGIVDRIVAKKTKIGIGDMLEPTAKDAEKGPRILVNGAPGVGKTTFSRKICKDWGSESIEALKQYELVVLLELRDRRLARATQIDEFFPHINRELQKQVVKQVEEGEGEKILIIMDGYDELKVSARQESLYLKIIKGEVLQKCTVIVTSRQYASDNLLRMKYIDRQVEVIGFTEAEIKKSIAASIPDQKKAEELNQFLKQRQDLACLCYIPLVCAIVTHVYKEDGYILPDTLTELYTRLVINLAKRNTKLLNDFSLSKWITDLNDLSQPTAYFFNIISEMAYHNLVQKEPISIFYHDELEKLPFFSCEVLTHTMGLITTVSSYSLYDNEVNYQFLHLTLQEFLAAWWIAKNLSPHEQGAFFNDNQENAQLRLVLVFLAGISKLETEHYMPVFQCKIDFTDKTDFQYINFDQNPEEKKKVVSTNYHYEAQRFLVRLLYLHEAQNSKLCHSFSEAVAHCVIDLYRTRLTLFHCMALGYFLANSSCSWKALNLPVHGLNDEYIRALCSRIPKVSGNGSHSGEISPSDESKSAKLQQIAFSSTETKFPVKLNDFSQSVVQSIVDTDIFNDCKGLRLLYRYFPKEKGVEDAFANLLSTLQSLESLYISRDLKEPDTHYKTFIEFGSSMKTAKSLRVLHLYRCGIDSYAVQFVADALKVSTAIEELKLCYNNITGEGSLHLFNALNSNCTVKCLDLTDNPGLMEIPLQVPNQCVEALEKMLSSNNCLESLTFDACGLDGTAVEAIARGLVHNRALLHLSMNIYLDPEDGQIVAPASVGVIAALNLFKALQINPVLKHLYFSFQFDQQMKYNKNLGDSIQCMLIENKSLECLSISLFNDESPEELYNRLTYFEVAIALGLMQNSSLSELSVYGLFFTPTACEKLFSTLKHNRTLKKLSIDLAYGDNVAETFADMLACNTSLEAIDTCYFIHILRDARTEQVIPGLELPKSMKTDRGEPEFEPFVQACLQKVDKHAKIFEQLDKIKHEFASQGMIKDSKDPIPQTLYGTYGVKPPASKGKLPPLHPDNIFPLDACIKIMNALKSNYSLHELHIPCSFSKDGTLRLVHKALLETVTCNPTLTLVKFHNDARWPFEQHHFAEFLEVYREEGESSRLQMKRFGHGTAGAQMKIPPGTLVFQRTWTERFDVQNDNNK